MTRGISIIAEVFMIVSAPLQPSCPQVSQNSVLIYDGVVSRMHESDGALTSSYAHDLDTTTLSLINCFIFLQTGRELMLLLIPWNGCWPLVVNAQSTYAQRRCASFTRLGSNGSSQNAEVDESEEHLQQRKASTCCSMRLKNKTNK
jgi:hypothetical protein